MGAKDLLGHGADIREGLADVFGHTIEPSTAGKG